MTKQRGQTSGKRRRWWISLLLWPWMQLVPSFNESQNDDQLDRLRRLQHQAELGGLEPLVPDESAVPGLAPDAQPLTLVPPSITITPVSIGLGGSMIVIQPDDSSISSSGSVQVYVQNETSGSE